MYMVYISFKGNERSQEIRFAHDLSAAIEGAKTDYAMRENVGFMEYSEIIVWGHKV